MELCKRVMTGSAVDVSQFRRNMHGDYLLPAYDSDIEYVDLAADALLGSVGCHRVSGQVMGSLRPERFAAHPDFECLFTR